MADKLTPKQARFVEEYLIDSNGTQAAIRAGYSENSAKETGARMLTNANIQKHLAEGRTLLSQKAEITKERILEEEARIGFADIGDAFSDGVLLSPDELPEALRRAVSGFEVEEKQVGDITLTKYKYRFWDKGRALERMCKMLGYNEPSQLDVNLNKSPELVIKLSSDGTGTPPTTE